MKVHTTFVDADRFGGEGKESFQGFVGFDVSIDFLFRSAR